MRYEDEYGFEDVKAPARKSAAVRKKPASDPARSRNAAAGKPRVKKRPIDDEFETARAPKPRVKKRPADEFDFAASKPRVKKRETYDEYEEIYNQKPRVKKRPLEDGYETVYQSKPRAKRPASQTSRPQAAQKRPARRVDYDDEYIAPVKKRAPKRGRGKRKPAGSLTALWIVIALAAAFALSTVLHANVFEVVRMSGDSMYATIKKGDIVVVNKLDKSGVGRGDLVAVKLPGEVSYIIRRVVGLPGETVSIEEGQTYIDDNAIQERYIGLETYSSFEGITLPPNKYYVLCDNRTDLSDSRASDISMVDISQIDGKASFRIWPVDRAGNIS